MRNYQQYAELETPSYKGANTSLQFSLIPRDQSPRMQNCVMDQDGDLSKRPGTIPVTAAALAAPIEHLALYKASPSAEAGEEIYATSGTTLHKFVGTTLTPLTMTALLNRADIHTTGFTNAQLVSRLLIGDGAALKQCDGSTVTIVNPAPSDTAPKPANVLDAVNAKGIKFIWSHTGHVFLSPGTNELFYSTRFLFDYVPEVQYFFLVRDNDYINGNGVSFDDVCLVPMRRGWAIVTGENFNNFAADRFLNTDHGVIAPRSIAKVTYPADGTQAVMYLSDNGVNEIYTAMIDRGGRQYATRSVMQGKINFEALGLTEAEKAAAVGEFHPEKFLYLLSFKKAGVNYTYAYDVRTREWYTDWLTFNAKAYASLNGTLYFAGQTGHLYKFDDDLFSDWNESTKTTGTPVHFKRYSPALALEFTGFPSNWDAYLVESQQWKVPATLDITFIFADRTDVMQKIIRNEVFVEGVSEWGFAKYLNQNFTDFVNEPNEILFDYSRLSKYVQVLLENPRNEPVKIFKDLFKGRVSGR